MSVQNFSSLAGLKGTEKFVVVVGWGGFQVATTRCRLEPEQKYGSITWARKQPIS